MRLVAILSLALSLSGCWQSQSRASSSFDVHGTMNGQPVTLHVDGDAATVTKAGVDPAAIQAAVAAGVEGIKSSIPGIAQIEAVMKAAVPQSQGVTAGEAAGGVAGAAGVIVAILKAMEAAKHKKDADEGWELAHANALKVPPDRAA